MHMKGVRDRRFRYERGVLNGSNAVKPVRIVRHPPETGYDVQWVVRHPVAINEKLREPIGIDVGIRTRCALSNGKMYAPVATDDSQHKRCQRRVFAAKSGSSSWRKKKMAWASEGRIVVHAGMPYTVSLRTLL